jgi:hypothetical protein
MRSGTYSLTFTGLVYDIEALLLLQRDSPNAEFDHERVFSGLLMQSMPQAIQHLHRRAHDLKELFLQQQIIRVHSHSLNREWTQMNANS